MKRVFMILTSHRLDCFKLAMDLLFTSRSIYDFDHVVLMLNGVVGKHKAYVDHLISSHPDIPWDTISGPRGKGPLVANLQNTCVERYPDALYFKVDEDVFVSEGWVDKLTRAYEAHADDPNLALVTCAIPNNAAGFYQLLNTYDDYRKEYENQFTDPLGHEAAGAVWGNPEIAEWAIRKFIDMKASNQALMDLADWNPSSRYRKFAYRFSINCLVYDYRHWKELGGIPDDEEPAWGQWVPDHGKFNVMSMDTLLQHYSFFVQQDWLDRTNILEELRRVNIPGAKQNPLDYHGQRIARIIQQAPRAISRKFKSLAN